MKKIPTLFKKQFENHKVVGITPEVTEGMEWVLKGEGVATVKWDGSACAIINGEFYKRYDAKKGKPIPDGAIKCQDEPDPITGHMPCWVKCDRDNPADKWFWAAYDKVIFNSPLTDGTYEAVGEHFNGNPYNLHYDYLIKHGEDDIPQCVYPLTSFNEIKDFLSKNKIEGIVFWKDGEPKCKIKRSDFGFPWNSKK